MTKNIPKAKAKWFDDFNFEDTEVFTKGRKKNKINTRNTRKEAIKYKQSIEE